MKYYGWGLPFDASVHGAAMDRLIYVIHIFMAVLFVGWLTFLVTALIKFRARPNHQADGHEKHFKIPTYLEVGVAIFELILLIGFSFPIVYQFKNERPEPAKSLRVRIAAEQFAWNIHYPGPDGKFGKTSLTLMGSSNPLGLDRSDPDAKDDITTINQLNIPVDKPVIVDLTSKDVIHSFFLPVMRVKQDAIPGQVIPVWFQATTPGKFEIACAQLCGLGHYRMRGFLNIFTQVEFDKWLLSKAPKIVPPPAPAVLTPIPAKGTV